MLSWSEKVKRASDEVAKHASDPLRAMVETTTRGMNAISTAALLDLIGLPNSTGNARRVSKTMRDLGYVPIKSRRLMPGGWKDTVTRGWARPSLPPRHPLSELKAAQLTDRNTGGRDARYRVA